MAAFTEGLLERIGGTTGAGVGAIIAAAVLAPRVARPLGRGLRTLAKGAIKGYIIVSSRTRVAVTEASEEWQQLYAEVKSEIASEVAGRNGHDVEAAAALSARERDGGEARERGGEGARERGSEGAKRPDHASRGARETARERDGGEARAGDGAEGRSLLVNLNEADREALMALPGVGERTAEKILQYREEHGRIGSLMELLDADVLHSHVVENLRDRVTI